MAINGPDFFEEKTRQFSAQSQPTRFAKDYVAACNDAIQEINPKLDLDTDVANITATQNDIGYSNYVKPALSAVVDYHLVKFGHKFGDLDLLKARRLADDAIDTARLARDKATRIAATTTDEVTATIYTD